MTHPEGFRGLSPNLVLAPSGAFGCAAQQGRPDRYIPPPWEGCTFADEVIPDLFDTVSHYHISPSRLGVAGIITLRNHLQAELTGADPGHRAANNQRKIVTRLNFLIKCMTVEVEKYERIRSMFGPVRDAFFEVSA